jgi:hypothetical protein
VPACAAQHAVMRHKDGDSLSLSRSILAAVGVCLLSVSSALAAESIAHLFRAEFTARNPLLVGTQILEFRSVSKKRGSDLVYGVRAIRADSKFEGKFEDEQFGVFIVDANRSKISKTLDMFNTPRWNDYELKIQSATRSKVVVTGRGATYGDQPFTKTYELIDK